MKKSIYGLIIITVLAISGCKKIDSIPTRFTPIPVTNSNVKILMLSPDAPQINFFADTVKISSIASTTSGAVQGLLFPSSYPATIGYASINPGLVKLIAKVSSGSTVTPGAVVLSTSQNFDPKKFYTYALVDSLSKISAVVVEDDPVVADPQKAYFRVANFVSNSSPVKIEIVKTSTGISFTKVYPSVAFKSVTTFEELEAGSGQVYKIYLKNSTTSAVLDSIAGFTPNKTKKYSVYSYGVFGQATKGPKITTFTNF